MQTVLRELATPKFIALYIYLASVMYMHFRGAERLRFLRQLTEPSGLFAPFNAVMYAFSKVPSDPILDVEDFPELEPLKQNWEVIRDEAKALQEGGNIRTSARHDDLAFVAFYRRGWKRFYLKWYGDALPSAKQLCPRTLELVNSIPSIKSAAYTLLPPGGTLGRHRDPYAGSLRYHLGLITPNSEKCRIFIDGQQHVWHDGEPVVFDETYVHWAENESDQVRIILFCDLVRPLYTPIARGLNTLVARTLIKGTTSRNVETEKVGLFNRLTPWIYKTKMVMTRFKQTRPKLYVAFKVVLNLGLAYLIFFRGLGLFQGR